MKSERHKKGVDLNEENLNAAKDEFSIESTVSDAIIITYLIIAYIILHAAFKRFVPDDSLSEQRKFIRIWFLIFVIILTITFIVHAMYGDYSKIVCDMYARKIISSWFTVIFDTLITAPIFVTQYLQNKSEIGESAR